MRTQPPLSPSFEPKRILLTVHAPRDLLRFRAAAGSPAPVGDLPRGCDGERRRRSKHAKRRDYVGLGVGLKSSIRNLNLKSIHYSNGS